ncbi:MAG: hypothetical protein KGN76_08045 [Acidobacteriota bacterium]|nr:hypothetical protein [Acidobacteriota bacterium]
MSDSQPTHALSIRGLIAAVVVVIGLQAALGLAVYLMFANWTDRDGFAGMFVVTESLFTGLAFAGVIYTVMLQRRELNMQGEQLALASRLSALATLNGIYSEMAEFLDGRPAELKQRPEHATAVVDVSRRREILIHELEATLGLEKSKLAGG